MKSILQLLIIFPLALLAGCRSLENFTSQNAPVKAPQAEAPPFTLFEPVPPAGEMGQLFVIDANEIFKTQSMHMSWVLGMQSLPPSTQMLNRQDVLALAKLNKPELLDVVNLSYMPDLRQVAAIANVIIQVTAYDPTLQAALIDLSDEADELTKKLNASPEQAQRYQKIYGPDINVLAARAIRGDSESFSKLAALSSEYTQAPNGQEIVHVMHDYMGVVKTLRSQVWLQDDRSQAWTPFNALYSREVSGAASSIAGNGMGRNTVERDKIIAAAIKPLKYPPSNCGFTGKTIPNSGNKREWVCN